MYSFSAFDLYDYLILLGIIIIALIVLLFLINNIRHNHAKSQSFFHGNFKVSIIIGVILIILSIIGYVCIERSHTGIFKEFSAATSEPFVFLSIAVLLSGVILLTIGFYKRKLSKQSLK